jgi:hypothetical protein
VSNPFSTPSSPAICDSRDKNSVFAFSARSRASLTSTSNLVASLARASIRDLAALTCPFNLANSSRLSAADLIALV